MANNTPQELDDAPSHLKEVLDEQYRQNNSEEPLGAEGVKYHLKQALEGDISGDVAFHIRSALRQLEAEEDDPD